MKINKRAVMLFIIVVISVLCISVLVYAASEKLYDKSLPKGTFVYQEITEEGY